MHPPSYLIVAVVIFLGSLFLTKGQTALEEVEALKELFSLTNGEKWNHNSMWLTNTDPCYNSQLNISWFGLVCVFDGTPPNNTYHAQQINLQQNGLEGDLSDYNWTRFSELKFLYLQLNQISGTINPSFYTLPLYITNLSLNQLEGTISPLIGNLKGLRFLNFGLNFLTGPIPEELWDLVKLQQLYLNINRQNVNNQFKGGLTGTISSKIKQLTELTILHLDGNSLQGTIPPEIWSLTSLVKLFLGNNDFSGNLATEIAYLIHLDELDISQTNVEGLIPEELFTLKNLTNLNLGLNYLEGTISSQISKLYKLIHLNLQSKPANINFRNKHFNGTIPESLWTLVNLQDLYLSFNLFTGTISEQVGQLIHITKLELDNNFLSGTIPESVWKIVNLTTLFLDDNQLTGTLSPNIELLNLTELKLGNNKFYGWLPSYFDTNHTITSPQFVLPNNDFSCPISDYARSFYGATCTWATLKKIEPSLGYNNITTIVSISGSNFSPLKDELTCSFGGVNSSIDWISPTLDRINCSALPTDLWGFVPFNIYHLGVSVLQANVSFLYFRTPELQSLSSTSWREQGSLSNEVIQLNISGNYFSPTGNTSCSFGDPQEFSSNFTVSALVINDKLIQCHVPAHRPGIVKIYVTNDKIRYATNDTSGGFVYYRYCSRYSPNPELTCNGHGTCINETQVPYCQCNSNFTSALDGCSNCITLHFGKNCGPCPICENNGNCRDGIDGDGLCVCPFGWFGVTCGYHLFVIVLVSSVCGVFLLILLFGIIIALKRGRSTQYDSISNPSSENVRLRKSIHVENPQNILPVDDSTYKAEDDSTYKAEDDSTYKADDDSTYKADEDDIGKAFKDEDDVPRKVQYY